MPPSREPSMSLLFHPKKNKKPVPHPNGSPRRNPLPGTTSRPKTSSASPAGTPSAVKTEEQDARNTSKEPEEDTFKLPEGPYQEFKVMSSALNGWKFDVMKFDSRKTVDLATWQGPVKLNRKDLRKEDPEAVTSTGPLKPMLGLDGQQVYGADGKPVMVDAEGKPVIEGAGTSGIGKGKGPNGPGKKKFQKKTKQVFIVPDEIRALRREERYPWVVEDATGQETWVAQLDELSKSTTHGFFMPAATGDIFKFVPSHRWYRFQKKLKHDLPTDTMTVETAYQKSQKRDPTAWLRQRNGKGPSAATAATFKAEAEGRVSLGGSGSLVQHVASSSAPGGRRLKAVDHGSELFGDDDEDGDYKRRRQKEAGGEGDLDENVYEEEFADDEEKMDVDDNDQEAKELEERLKREYKNANKTREGYIDESDEEDVKPVIGKQGKAMKKMLRNREEGDAYDSEEEENPYASSAEEEEEEEAPPQAEGPAVMQQPQQIKPKQEPTETTIPKGTPSIQNGTATPLSPEPPSPTSPTSPTSGHSLLAKRATSPPKAPKVKTEPGSRAGSPLASSRAGSPVAGSGSRASSPVNGQAHLKKRKAEDSGPSPASPPGANGNASQVPKAKKRKATVSGGVPTPTGPLEEWMLVDWLKNTPNASTKECIQHFGPYLKDEKEKARFTALVKELASLKNGKLVLKSHYRGSAGPATPTAS